MEFSTIEKVYCTSWAISFNCEESARQFREKFNKEPPSSRTILYWKNKLLETGSLSHDRPRSGRPITASGDENRQKVIEAVTENPSTSTRAISRDVGISDFTVRKVLKAEHYHPYKPLYSQFLCDGDEDRRLQFCEEMRRKSREDPAFLRKLTFSDECVMSLTGNINKHNVHFWTTTNPNIRMTNPGKTPSLTVWACIGYSGLLLYDISSETMNGKRYSDLLLNQVVPYFSRGTGRTLLFQQDGAPPHYSLSARQILETHLSNRWIGRRGPIEWPARSPDLTPCDFWFWSHLRQLVYPPGFIYRNIQDLREEIERQMNNIALSYYRDSLRNFQKRFLKCIEHDGELFEE